MASVYCPECGDCQTFTVSKPNFCGQCGFKFASAKVSAKPKPKPRPVEAEIKDEDQDDGKIPSKLNKSSISVEDYRPTPVKAESIIGTGKQGTQRAAGNFTMENYKSIAKSRSDVAVGGQSEE